jgi:hypothetical protein
MEREKQAHETLRRADTGARNESTNRTATKSKVYIWSNSASNDLVRGAALESSTWSREGEEALRATHP